MTGRRRRWTWGIALGLGLLALRGRCEPDVRVATFNIRMFPEPTTDLDRVATTIAELDADLIGVQEITDRGALMAVLQRASRQTGREYRAVLSHCRSTRFGITTGLVWDASRWRLVEHREYPDLLPDRGVGCGEAQPGILGVFADDRGRRMALLCVHFDPFPAKFEVRREQWRRLVAIQRSVLEEKGVTLLTVGDFNSTGFTGEPPEERDFVRETVDAAGFRLLTTDLPCSEYYLPENGLDFLPSVLDHVIATDGRWSSARVLGLCDRLACRTTPADRMDEDFVRVSDHCPVLIEGAPAR